LLWLICLNQKHTAELLSVWVAIVLIGTVVIGAVAARVVRATPEGAAF
jgi:hypothetical protein